MKSKKQGGKRQQQPDGNERELKKRKISEEGREMVTAVIDESHDWWMSHPSVHFTAQDHTHIHTHTNTYSL